MKHQTFAKKNFNTVLIVHILIILILISSKICIITTDGWKLNPILKVYFEGLVHRWYRAECIF